MYNIYVKLEGVEPPTFGSGIRRATNYAIASNKEIKIFVYIYIYSFIPRPGIEPGSPG